MVVFEANAAMTVLAPDAAEHFVYRAASSEAVADALLRMFRRRSA